jgi:hypothetical protein
MFFGRGFAEVMCVQRGWNFEMFFCLERAVGNWNKKGTVDRTVEGVLENGKLKSIS